MRNKIDLLLCVMVFILLALGCKNSNKNTNTLNSNEISKNVNVLTSNEVNKNTNRLNSDEVNQAITSEQKTFNKSYDSGGIGLERNDWEAKFGNGKQNVDSFVGYENDKYILQFSFTNPANVSYIERVYGDKNAVLISEARQESKKFIPNDAKFVKTYISQSGSTIDLYKSESLKSRFPESEFINGKSGDFIILYRNQTGKTTTFIIAIGNNP